VASTTPPLSPIPYHKQKNNIVESMDCRYWTVFPGTKFLSKRIFFEEIEKKVVKSVTLGYTYFSLRLCEVDFLTEQLAFYLENNKTI